MNPVCHLPTPGRGGSVYNRMKAWMLRSSWVFSGDARNADVIDKSGKVHQSALGFIGEVVIFGAPQKEGVMGSKRPSKRRTLLRKVSYTRGKTRGHASIQRLLAARGIGKKIRRYAKCLPCELGPAFVRARFLKSIKFHWVIPSRI